MKHEFRLVRPAYINKRELPVGALVATVETPEGVPVERALAAIAGGHAVESAPPPAPLAPEVRKDKATAKPAAGVRGQ